MSMQKNGKFWSALVFAAVALLAIGGVNRIKPWIQKLDMRVLDGYLVDLHAARLGQSDWTNTKTIPKGLPEDWMAADSSGALRLAHAMGGWGRPGEENELPTLRRALAVGFRVIEVDFTLGNDGRLYCFHGPGEPPIAMRARVDVCDFDAVLAEMKVHPFFLVLDLKTDFSTAAALIAQKVEDPNIARRIIFQLYSPQDVNIFVEIAAGRFASPIVTLYRTTRTRYHLLPQLRRIGVLALAVPIERIEEFPRSDLPTVIRLLSHPLRSCAELKNLVQHGYSGGYVSSLESCLS